LKLGYGDGKYAVATSELGITEVTGTISIIHERGHVVANLNEPQHSEIIKK
jgi:hypothetical protein